jgi:hypothetical protein
MIYILLTGLVMMSFLRFQVFRPGHFFATLSPTPLGRVPGFKGLRMCDAHPGGQAYPLPVPLAFARGQGVPHAVTPLK